MGIVFRQAVKSVLVHACGILLGAASVWLTSQVLAKEQLGGSRLLINQSMVIQFFLLLGTPVTVFVFSPKYGEEDPRRKVLISIALLVPLVTICLFCIPYFGFKEAVVGKFQIDDRWFMDQYYAWLPVLSLLFAFFSVFELYLGIYYKVALAVFMREVALRLLNLVVLGLFFLKWISFSQYIAGTVCATLIPLLFLFNTIRKLPHFGFSFRISAFSRPEQREILRFTWYHLLTGASINLLPFLDSILLGPLGGFEEVAIYTNALFIANVMVFAYRALSGAAIPDLNATYVKNDRPRLADLYRRSALNIQVASAAVWLVIVSNLQALTSLFPPGYEAIVPLVLILSIGKMTDMFSGLNHELLSISRHYRINLYTSTALVVLVIVLDRIFIPRYGIFGAAWVTTGTSVALNAIKAFFLKKKEGLHPFYGGTLKTLGATAAAWLAQAFFPWPELPVFVEIALRTALVGVVFGGLILWLQPSEDIKQYLLQMRRNKRLF